jgi:cyclin-dependent kinase 12/13
MLGKRSYHTFIEPSGFKAREVTEYTEIEKVGAGAFGLVSKATTKKDPTKIVALKKILTDQKKDDPGPGQGFPITTIREIMLLKKLSHPNVVKLLDVVKSSPPPTTEPADQGPGQGQGPPSQANNPANMPPMKLAGKRGSIFLVFEYMEHDLMGLTRKYFFSLKNSGKIQLDLSHIKCIMTQL